MKLLGWHGSVASVAVGLTCLFATAVWAGGSSFDDEDDTTDEGPAFFGFVRDPGGATIPDAKVTVGIANRGGVVTRTDSLGAYKVPGFGKEVDPKDVIVSCEKEGYKQVKVVRRDAPASVPIVETECTLARNS